MFLAGLIVQRDLSLRDVLDAFELHIYKQWLRVNMRSKMIKHNKDLFQSLDDPLAMLDKLHIYRGTPMRGASGSVRRRPG